MKKTLSQPANLLHTIMLCMSERDMDDCLEDFDDEGTIADGIEDLDSLLADDARSKSSFRRRGKPAAKVAPKLKERLIASISSLRQHSSLASYQLSENDVMAAAYLWGHLAVGRSRGEDWDDTLSWCKINKRDLTGNLRYLGSLLDRNIIVNVDSDATGHQLDPYNLMQGKFMLHSSFRHDLQLREPRKQIEASLHPVWNTKGEMERDLILFRNLLLLSYPEFSESLNSSTHRCHRILIDELIKPLQNMITTADRHIPLIGLIDAQQPTDTDLIVLLWTYTDYLVRDHSPLCLLANLISSDHGERLQMEANLSFSPSLNELGLRHDRHRSPWSERGYMVLCERVLSTLKLDGEKSDDDVSDMSGNLTELKASQSFDDLILPAEDKDLLAAAIKRYGLREEADLSGWGLMTPLSGDPAKGVKGTCFLLYGEPGTGKTFSAGAIANALGRKLLAIDASRLRDKYYGESEKILRRTFASMRKLVEGSDNPPVFLLNEADQIIHRRGSTDKSCGEVENAIQNIFLEELETFPGILILTTNLVENIHDAYFRRFDVKIELHRPDYECRVKLWRLHLPESIPGASKIDCDYMARSFELSGGQISLVVSNACSEAITRSASKRRLTQDDLVRYASLEDPWSCSEEKKRRIGFCA